MKLRSGESGERLPLSRDFFLWLHGTDLCVCVCESGLAFFLGGFSLKQATLTSSRICRPDCTLLGFFFFLFFSLGLSSSQVVVVLVSLTIRSFFFFSLSP